MKTKLLISILALTSVSSTFAQQTCPLPATAIDPSLLVQVSHDRNTGIYTYKYSLSNGRSSPLSLWRFSMLVDQEPSAIQSPANWAANFVNNGVLAKNVSWGALPQPRDVSLIDPGELYPRLTEMASTVKAGGSIRGFVIKSNRPPGISQYFAEGFTQVPTVAPVAGDDEPTPTCEGWDFDNSRFDTLVTGITTGPSSPDVTQVKIRLRDDSGKRRCKPIDPSVPRGAISVLVLSTKSFDASDIDVASVAFGPGGAHPVSSYLIPGDDDFDADDGADWERWDSDSDNDKGKGPKKKNLLLVFNQADLEIKCGLDRALFLKGKTNAGIDILGGAVAPTAGCDVRKPHRRPHHNSHHWLARKDYRKDKHDRNDHKRDDKGKNDRR